MSQKKDKITLPSDKDAEKNAIELAGQKKSLEKRGYFDSLGDVYEEDLFPKGWTEDRVQKAAKELLADRRFVSGFWAQIPRVCSTTCLNRMDCKMTDKPVGNRCPQEIAFLELLMRKYISDLNVPMDDMSSVSMIRDLCDIEIQLIRKQGYLATEEMILDEPILDSDGVPTDYVKRYENPMMGTQVKLITMKNAILKSLVATRESRFKAMQDLNKEDEMSRAVRALRELKKSIEKGVGKDGSSSDYHDPFIEADYEIIDQSAPDNPEE